MKIKITSKDFRVTPGEKVNLKQWPTRVKPFCESKSHVANYPNQPASSEAMLDALQRDAFGYFLHETNPANSLVADKTQLAAVAQEVEDTIVKIMQEAASR